MPGCRYKPQGLLAALVECLWYWEDAPGPHLQERLLPNGEAAMILNLREDAIAIYEDDGSVGRYGHAVLSGPRSNCFTIDCNQQERVVGVQFRPGARFPSSACRCLHWRALPLTWAIFGARRLAGCVSACWRSGRRRRC